MIMSTWCREGDTQGKETQTAGGVQTGGEAVRYSRGDWDTYANWFLKRCKISIGRKKINRIAVGWHTEPA